MFLHTKSIVATENAAMIWLGNMSDLELEEYLDEPGGRIDGLPQSKFAEDLLRFYDHDYLWAVAEKSPIPVADLVLKTGIADASILKFIEKQGFGERCFSTLFVLWNYENILPLDQSFAGGKLQFIGSCDCVSPLT